MINPKYLSTETFKTIDGRTVYQIQAVRDFGDVKAGEFGGFIECESILSQEGLCWIDKETTVLDHSVITGDSIIKNSFIENSTICGNSLVIGSTLKNAEITSSLIELTVLTSTDSSLPLNIKRSHVLEGIVVGKYPVHVIENTIEDMLLKLESMTTEERESLYTRIVQEGLI